MNEVNERIAQVNKSGQVDVDNFDPATGGLETVEALNSGNMS